METSHWQQMQAEFARMFAMTPAPDRPVPMDQERDDDDRIVE